MESLEDELVRISSALLSGDLDGMLSSFGESVRHVELPGEPGPLEAGAARWVQRHGWRLDRTPPRSMSLAEVHRTWSRFLGHLSELESADLHLSAASFDASLRNATATVALVLTGRDRSRRRERISGSLGLTAARGAAGRWTVETLDVQSLDSMVATRDMFTEVSAAAGISLPAAAYDRGAAAGDLNNDGLIDLVVTGLDGLHVYINMGDGRFEDRTAKLTSAPFVSGTGVLLVDVDNDGDEDVFLTSGNQQILLENRLIPDGVFDLVDVSLEAGVALPTVGYSAAAGDVNGDGLPDIYVCGYNRMEQVTPNSYLGATNGRPNLLFINDGGGRFHEAAAELGVQDRRWSYDAEFVDVDGDGDLDLYVTNDFGENALYLNQLKETGRLGFREAGRERGATRLGFGMGVSFGDYDNDGDLDLHATYLSATSVDVLASLAPKGAAPIPPEVLRVARGNALYENVGGGRFREVTEAAGPFPAGWAWGGGFVDVDNDGWVDIHSVNGMMSASDRRDVIHSFVHGLLSGDMKVAASAAASSGVASMAAVPALDMSVVQGGAMELQRGSTRPTVPRAPAAAVAAAAPERATPAPAETQAPQPPTRRPAAPAQAVPFIPMGGGRSLSGHERDVLYLNLGTKRFLDVSGVSGIDSETDGRAAVYADFDDDGDPDILVTSHQGVLLFRNEIGQDAGHIRVSLEGTRSGRDAYGAVVRVKSSAGVQAKVKAGGEGHLSQHDPRLLFGLGKDHRAEWLEVTWPSGLTQRFGPVPAGQSIRIREGEPGVQVVKERPARLAPAVPSGG
jgi:hypothetical protein